MKVELKKQNEVKFRDISIGGTFLYDGRAYIATETIKCKEKDRRNALSLESGYMAHFSPNIPVEPIKLKVVVA